MRAGERREQARRTARATRRRCCVLAAGLTARSCSARPTTSPLIERPVSSLMSCRPVPALHGRPHLRRARRAPVCGRLPPRLPRRDRAGRDGHCVAPARRGLAETARDWTRLDEADEVRRDQTRLQGSRRGSGGHCMWEEPRLAEMPPRCRRDAAEMPPRCRRGEAGASSPPAAVNRPPRHHGAREARKSSGGRRTRRRQWR